MIVTVCRSSCQVQYRLFFSDFNETYSSFTGFLKLLKYEISLKPVQWEPNCSMRTARRTDMTKLIVAFRNFAKAPKKLNSSNGKFGPVLN